MRLRRRSLTILGALFLASVGYLVWAVAFHRPAAPTIGEAGGSSILIYTSVISVALTGAGVLSRTFFAWRYDRRDRERLRTQLERERLELEQVKREVERLSEREERHKD